MARQFPATFHWGAATAAYQIEGAVNESGRGESIWDRFARTPGRTTNGDTGDIACDHYHRWQDDFQLLHNLGVNAYRFSIAWPRIFPNGYGKVNTVGLDHYDRQIDALLRLGITPWATLFHWDLPQTLYDKGGWLNRDAIAAFCDYTDVVTQRLGDRVKHWLTLNEPTVHAYLGYWTGNHAPGEQSVQKSFQVLHHILVAHGQAVPIVRANAAGARVGLAHSLNVYHPVDDREESYRASQRFDGVWNRMVVDAVAKETYPADIIELLGQHAPEILPNDMKIIATPIDVLGINYYSRIHVKPDNKNGPFFMQEVPVRGVPKTAYGWEVYPDGLREAMVNLHERYQFPAYAITENGAAFDDTLGANDVIADSDRQRYIEKHIESTYEAMNSGVPILGYFLWSLLDNFEWDRGFSMRFGAYYVDFATQRRYLKQSGRWYREFLARERDG